MIPHKSKYFPVLLLIFLSGGCGVFQRLKLKNHIPEDGLFLKNNKVNISGESIDSDEVEAIIRQKANLKTLGVRFRMRAYMLVDSAKVAEKRIKKNERLREKNFKKRKRQAKINNRRIRRARENNEDFYQRKVIPLKDTLNPKLFFQEWLKYKYGEKPVVLDTGLMNRTIQQHQLYLKKKGFYYGQADGKVVPKKKFKVNVEYSLETGSRYYIDSVYYRGSNSTIQNAYQAYVERGELPDLEGQPFDRDVLDNHRSQAARQFRNDAYFGFSPSHITYISDTTGGDFKVTLGIVFSNRVILSDDLKDTLAVIPHQTTTVRRVYFHISDTSLLDRPFSEVLAEAGLETYEGQFLNTTDTLRYNKIIDKETGEPEPFRQATFYYNGELLVKPGVMESQNYLEETNVYKEYYLDRTYNRLLQLGIFNVVKPEIVEIRDSNCIDVHYYLVPSNKQTFSFEPRFTNSNGFLGVSASVNYINKNLFRGAERMTIGLSGGVESQPPVFQESEEERLIENNSTSFNTLDFGPTIKFEIPGLFPAPLTSVSKRHRPKTEISAAYNYQRRAEYERHTFQANYLWKMYVGKTQIFQYGLPILSVLKFVNINKSPFFANQIEQFNDRFLINAYSNQLIWQDWKFAFEYNNKERDFKKSKFLVYNIFSCDPAGNFISLFQSIQDTNDLGRYEIFGVPYSRFVKFDNDFIASYPITKKNSIHLRALGGYGFITGNKETSLPFDYSFFAGGSNDNRGWSARSLGPGVYKYWLDTNRTLTQIGDVRIGGSVEFRQSLGGSLKGALFLDAGNIWTAKLDTNRLGGQFTTDWFKQLAYSAGVGLRIDLDFFVIRLDLGFKINNPSLPEGSRWVWQPRDAFEDALVEKYGETTVDRLREQNRIPPPFRPQLHFGIGYPF